MTSSKFVVLALLALASTLSAADVQCEAGTAACGADDDAQSLLQAYVRPHRELAENMETGQLWDAGADEQPDGGYQVTEPCRVEPGWIITLTGGRSNKFCSDRGNKITCDADAVGANEEFEVVDAGDSRIGLRGNAKKGMCADTGTAIECDRPWIKKWEWYNAKSYPGNRVSFQGARANTFCTDAVAGVKCDQSVVGTDEKFLVNCRRRLSQTSFTLLYSLLPGDTVVVETQCPVVADGKNDFTVSFCLDSKCEEVAFSFNADFTKRAVIRNSRLGGQAGQPLTGGKWPETLAAGTLTVLRFPWFKDGWQVTVNDIRTPDYDFPHRTQTPVSVVKVEGSGCKPNFRVERATTTPRPTTTRATTTTTRATTTRATTTTTRATTTTARPTTTTAAATTARPATTTANDGYQ